METAIVVEHLSHRYGTRPALDDISFSVTPGEVVALLGPNGAGKTTTVRLLNGLIAPSSGYLRVLGLDPIRQGDAVRRQSGVLTETPALYERLTARQNLQFFGTLADMPASQLQARIAELLSFFNLSARADERTGTYSKGMKQRLALARALLAHPALLFLDEPTSGLDPEAAQQVHELIAAVRHNNGQTVLLATHNLVEAERLCDRVAILRRGRLLEMGSLSELRQRLLPGLRVQLRLFTTLPSAAIVLARQPGILSVDNPQPNQFNLRVSAEDVIPPLVNALSQAGGQILSIQPQQTSLEELYFKLQNAEGGA